MKRKHIRVVDQRLRSKGYNPTSGVKWTVFRPGKGKSAQYKPLHLIFTSDYIPVVSRPVARDKAYTNIQKHERRTVVILFAGNLLSTLVVFINVWTTIVLIKYFPDLGKVGSPT